MDDSQFRRLLDFYGLSWNGYRKVRKGVEKRISRHMRQLGCQDMDEYLSFLRNDPELAAVAERLLTVSISRFFRDRGMWQALDEHILPDILPNHKNSVHVWSAGCARGEEVYTFKILWERMRDRFSTLPELRILATDMNPAYLEEARKGTYRKSSLKEVPAEWQAVFLRPVSEGVFAVSEKLKSGITWQVHHLISDQPPQDTFAIIFLRNNLLTYYKNEVRDSPLLRIVDHLAHRGFLIIGAHENLPADTPLTPSPYYPKIFQKG